MNDILLNVRPVGYGWVVECADGVEPLLFHSGARAEAQAHALAQCIAALGRDARILVHDRAQQMVGSTLYFGADPDDG